MRACFWTRYAQGDIHKRTGEVSKQQSTNVLPPISVTAQLQIFFRAGSANMDPLQEHPTEGALFSDGVNIYPGAGVEEVHFSKFKK